MASLKISEKIFASDGAPSIIEHNELKISYSFDRMRYISAFFVPVYILWLLLEIYNNKPHMIPHKARINRTFIIILKLNPYSVDWLKSFYDCRWSRTTVAKFGYNLAHNEIFTQRSRTRLNDFFRDLTSATRVGKRSRRVSKKTYYYHVSLKPMSSLYV